MATGGVSRRGPRAIAVDLPRKGGVTVYAGVRVVDALQEVTAELNLYQGVKLGQVLEAVYDQGLRDGRRQLFDEFDKLKQRPELSHRNPGRPAKRVTATKARAKKATRKTKRATAKKSVQRRRKR